MIKFIHNRRLWQNRDNCCLIRIATESSASAAIGPKIIAYERTVAFNYRFTWAFTTRRYAIARYAVAVVSVRPFVRHKPV